MKKRLIQLALILGLMTLTCVAAQASESKPTSGFMNLSVEANYKEYVTLYAMDDKGKTVTEEKDDNNNTLYPGAVKVGVTYKNPQNGSEYLLIVLSDDNSTPSVDNMAYIDQKTAGSTGIDDFIIYPKKVTVSSVKYSVYMSSSTAASAGNGVTGYVKVGSFEYYSTGLDVTLGDVDDDGDIMVGDAVLVLRAVVEDIVLDDRQTAAADVDRDGDVMVGDAVYILRYVVEDITSFDNLGK